LNFFYRDNYGSLGALVATFVGAYSGSSACRIFLTKEWRIVFLIVNGVCSKALREKISEDMKTAMKSGDKIRLETIRSIRALILEFDKSGANRELTPEDEIAMLSTAVKKRRESVEMFTKAGRMDLAGKESAELNILQEYLPKQLSEDELIEEIKNIALQVNASTKADFAKLMPAAMKQFKGKAEGKIVKSLVEKFLGIS